MRVGEAIAVPEPTKVHCHADCFFPSFPHAVSVEEHMLLALGTLLSFYSQHVFAASLGVYLLHTSSLRCCLSFSILSHTQTEPPTECALFSLSHTDRPPSAHSSPSLTHTPLVCASVSLLAKTLQIVSTPVRHKGG